MIPIFRLTNEPGGLGLSCTPDGLSLAGVSLLRKTEAGFAPRSAPEIASLLKAGYDDQKEPARLQTSLGAIADALNRGDLARAGIIAVLTRTPELSDEAALRLAKTEEWLAKYNFDPAQPRDWHGRWTRDVAAGSVNISAPVDLSVIRRETDLINPSTEADHSDGRRYASATSDDSTGSADEPDHDDAAHSQEPTSARLKLEQKYHGLDPVEFSKEVIQFGYRLATSGPYFSAAEKEQALTEYSFLQERLSAWLASDAVPPRVHGYLLSAAMFLYQGAIAAEIAEATHVPESMVDVVGGVLAFDTSPQTRSRAIKPDFETAPSAITTPKQPKETPANEPSPLQDGQHEQPANQAPSPGNPATIAGAAASAPVLPEFVPGGKTTGILRTPSGDVTLISGWNGPSSAMPPKSSGFDIVSKTHVEGHAAAVMRQQGLTEATLYINNPEVCGPCVENLPRMLPPKSKLRIVLPNGSVITFWGKSP